MRWTGARIGRATGAVALLGALLTASTGAGLAHASTYSPLSDPGSMYNVVRQVKATGLWTKGVTGKGVDVALIDSGTVPIPGLSSSGKVVAGPDLSFESQSANLAHLDTFGHGTHLAGIIAGRDPGISGSYASDTSHFLGVAPDARLISLKVADQHGVTDVSQVISAINWVVKHRSDAGMNIRVLNLAFGTDGVQTYLLDPLARAVEQAWRAGIVVVVSAGNEGFGNPQLNNPAFDPFVIAVGADDPHGTISTADDSIPSWSSKGNLVRVPDLVAPGKSVVSLRDPNSYIDQSFPTSIVASRFTRGSGTSQAAAVVSGGVALLLQARPSLGPDQVKKILTATASKLPSSAGGGAGAGLLNLTSANSYTPLLAGQLGVPSTGLGSLELARGTLHVEAAGVTLTGETDIFGTPFVGGLLGQLGSATASVPFLGTVWNAVGWGATDFAGQPWSDPDFSSHQWSGGSWDSHQWSSHQWSSHQWSGDSWSSAGWGP